MTIHIIAAFTVPSIIKSPQSSLFCSKRRRSLLRRTSLDPFLRGQEGQRTASSSSAFTDVVPRHSSVLQLFSATDSVVDFLSSEHQQVVVPADSTSDIVALQSLSSSSLSSYHITAATTPTTTTTTTFDPVLNLPAFICCVSIFILFIALQLRVAAIQQAAEQRDDALTRLREMKSKQLAGEAASDQVTVALKQYKQKVKEVEDLRSVIPGVARIVPPAASAAAAEQAEQAAFDARRFLGTDDDHDDANDDNDNDDNNTKNNNRQGNDASISSSSLDEPETQERKLPLAAVLVLAVIVVAEIGLLAMMSVDPMTTGGGTSSGFL